MKQRILGYAVDSHSVEGCADSVFNYVRKATATKATPCAWLACLNPHSYTVALQDEVFNGALMDAEWLVPDGSGVVLASRILGGRMLERVTGSDVFYGLHQRMDAVGGMSVFFLGATEDTLAAICLRMARDFPAIRVAGTYSPPFKPCHSDEEVSEMIDAVNAASPDVLWVGMTAPKQEKWIYENRTRLNVKFAGAIGAAFDFYAGRVKRAHPVFQQLGLEWLPRLIQQPGRLWRRMFVSAPIFLWHVLIEKVRNY